MRYRFGEFELDTDAYTLTRSGRALHLRPKVFDLVRFLIERRERAVSKRELLDALWEGEHVTESVLPWAVSHARRALGQVSRAKAPIETLHSRGYRWRAPVEVVEERATASAPALPRPEASPFVGRAELMERLRSRLVQAQAGRGGLCLLVGEPGIGKTRCMDELASSAVSFGFSIWSGRAIEDPWAPALWPFTQVLRCAAQDGSARERASRLLVRLGAALGETSAGEASADADPQRQRFLLLDDIARFLLQASSRRPLLLLIDDLHWADAGSVGLLAAIAPELRSYPLLVLASQRDQPAEHRARRPPQLARYAERIDLPPLTASDVAHYIGLVTRAGAADAALSAAVHSATAGNALFLQETVRALVAQHGARGLLALSPADVKPPQLARDVLRERLDLLEPRTRKALRIASVLGESFELDLLHKVSELELPALIGALDDAVQARLVTEEDPHRYRFNHALLRNVLYDELPASARIAVHRRAAEAIERVAHLVPRQRELAHHYYRSLPLGGARQVAAAARRAAEEAVRTLEFEDAALFSAWALEAQSLVPEASARERAELLLLRARSARHAGRRRDARAAVAQLVEVASRHGFADLLVRAARILRPGRTWTAFRDETTRTALEEVLRIVPEPSDENRISALSQLATVAPYALDLSRSKELSASAVELSRPLGKPALLGEALRARLYALSGPDDIDAMLAVAQEMLALDAGAESWISLAAHSARYVAAIHRGDLPAAEKALAALGHTARKQRRPEALWYHERLRAQRRFIDGECAGTESAFEALARTRLSHRAWLFRIPQALLMMDRQGTPKGAVEWDLPALLSRTEDRPAEHAALARIALELDRPDLARTVLERLSAGDFGIPKNISYLNTLVSLSLLAIRLEDRVRAERIYELLAPYPRHNTPSGLLYYEGSVSHYLARLAEFLGRQERARAHYEDALAMNEALGHKPQLARTCYEYARFLRERGVDRDRSDQLKAEAERLAEALDMPALSKLAHALA